MAAAKLTHGLRTPHSLASHSAVLAGGISLRKGLPNRHDLSLAALTSLSSRKKALANVAITPMGDELTSAMAYDGAINRGSASVHNWALSRFSQPWSYTGLFGSLGDTTVLMLARLQPAIDATRAAVLAGNRTYFSDWSGTNDILVLPATAADITAHRVTMWTQAQLAGAHPLIWMLAGSELYTASQTQKMLNLNAMCRAWSDTYAGDQLRPVICDVTQRMWYRQPDLSMTDTNVCLSQTPAANVPMTINGALSAAGIATFAQGNKLLFTHSDATKSVTVNGTDISGNAISETVTLTSGSPLVSSSRIYKTVTSITSAVSFTNPLKVGGCCISHNEGHTSDGLHPTVLGAWTCASSLMECVASDCIMIPAQRVGTQLLPNVTFSTLTGGVLGANTTCSSGATPPVNWRTNNSSATTVTSCDFFFRQNEGMCDINFVTTAAASLAGPFFRYDPPAVSFTPGKTYDLWMNVFIPAGGAQSLVDVSVELSMNYAAGTKTYYADRATVANSSPIPSSNDQWLTIRFSGIPVDAGTLNSANFFVRAHAIGAGSNRLSVGGFGLMEIPS